MMARARPACALGASMLVLACGGAKPAEARAPGPPLPAAAVPAPTRRVPPPVASTAPPVPAPIPAPSPGAAPSLDAMWGTAHPLLLVAAAPDRRWVSVCQARRDTNGDGRIAVDLGPQGELGGDTLEGYFIGEPGAGTPIEAFVGNDPTGRFVAFVQSQRLVLRDTLTSVDADLSALGADTRDDQGSYVTPRVGAFDPTGRRFLYLRRNEAGARVVVRDLATATEAVIDPGAGDLYRAAFDPSGEWVVLRVVAGDTNGNGRIEWPVPLAAAPRMRCGGPIPRFTVFERSGDEAVVRVARVTGGPATDSPGLIVPLGDTLIERNADGMLVRGKPSGGRSAVIRAGCGSRLLHADAARNLLLVTCTGPKAKADAVLITKDVVKPMGIELSASTGDRVQDGAPRLVALHPGADAVLVDLETRRLEKLQTGDRILTVSGPRALVLRRKNMVIHEIGGKELALPGEVLPVARMLLRGTTVVVPPYVIDLVRGVLVGLTSEAPLAVSRDGAVLSATAGADTTHPAMGPLKWTLPVASMTPRVR